MVGMYQQEVEPFILYSIEADPRRNGSSIQPYIQVTGDPVMVYSSTKKPSTPPNEMISNVVDGLQGVKIFKVIPNYLYFTNEDGAQSTIILSGVKATPIFELVSWLKKDNYSLSGNFVNIWKDSTPFSDNAAAVDNETRPQTNSDTINGNNVVTFSDGKILKFENSLNSIPQDDFTIFAVVRPIEANSCAILGSVTENDNNKFTIGLDNSGNFPAVSLRCGTGAAVKQDFPYQNQAFIVCAKRFGTELSISVNNSIPTVNSNAESINDLIGIYLAIDQDSDDFFVGDMGEIRIYNVALSDAQITTINQELALEWGVTLQERFITYTSGMLVQYDYKDAATITLNSNKLALVLDKSGRNITSSQTNASLQPPATGIVGDLTTAPLFSNSQYMRFLGQIGLSGSQPWTAFIVFSTTTTNFQNGPITFGSSTFQSGKIFSFDINIVTNQNGIRTISGNIRFGNIYGAGGSFIVAITYPGGAISNCKFYLNNELQSPTITFNPTSVPDLIDEQLLIGGFGNGSSGITPNFRWTGAMAFYGKWGGVMPNEDLTTTYLELATRYNI